MLIGQRDGIKNIYEKNCQDTKKDTDPPVEMCVPELGGINSSRAFPKSTDVAVILKNKLGYQAKIFTSFITTM